MFIPSLIFFLLLPLFFIFFKSKPKPGSEPGSDPHLPPKSYPIIGTYLSIYANRHRLTQWTSDLLRHSPTLTAVIHRPFGQRRILTADPAVVQHILKTNFPIYQKGHLFRSALFDVLGNGIFNVDGDDWKLQRQLSSHEFNTKSLRHFVEHVVDDELNHRLIPILTSAARGGDVLDLQDILQRFAFDNICKIAFGYDPAYLTPSLPQAKFAVAFDDGVRISTERFRYISPVIWKIQKLLNIGSEKRLKLAVAEIREFAGEILKEKKEELSRNPSVESVDLLSRFLRSGSYDEDFMIDIVISFILAGRDTTSAALVWFFWLIWRNPAVEVEILNEIKPKSKLESKSDSDSSIYDEVKDMIYTHASLCESMRLYPPVPVDSKMASSDDVLPDGTAVKRGEMVSYHPYAMGRVERLWGKDWPEFRPERWLEKEETAAVEEKWRFVARDPYTYPVFQAGPRVCLGKEMAFLQMKRVVAGVLGRFKVVPVAEDGGEPVYLTALTSKMKGGLPVKIVERK
ncbi:hypothetical protein OSB04_023253 [Centaurea solstitialis]|uniref:Cytochrome P450 n=1 Tax=Centaurea solstitialis TaxID=347529 RepID=A0AA38WCQ5_9ASTR|nr:hypothetical protein OSB04_023253 [Centaurea solstitialis]